MPYLRLALLLSLSLGASACGGDSPSSPKPRRFVTDAQGRALILHGANVDNHAKGSLDNQPALTPEDVATMAREWGFNFSRHLIFWSAVEPQMGIYDEAYLDAVEDRLDWYAEHGIHVLVDMHQDVYSARFCCDGAPDWAIHSEWEGYQPTELWSLNYLTPQVKTAWDNFWSYEGEHAVLQDHYAAMWAHVAERFRDHPAVLGYDIMNEPHPGSDFEIGDVLDLESGPDGTSAVFERTKLAPFYQRVIDAIREVDDEHWIFFEPRYGGPGDGARVYLPRLDDPRSGQARLVYAPHMYSFRLEASGDYADDDHSLERFEIRRMEDLDALDCPIVIGEWGLDQNVDDADVFAESLMSMSDRLLAGWAYWSFDPGAGGWAFWYRNEDPTEPYGLNPNAEAMIRAYPQRIAGQPIAIDYDVGAAVLRIDFERRRGVRGPTVIYLPPAIYGGSSFTVRSSDPEGAWSYTYDPERNLLSVESARNVDRHVITVLPALIP